MKTLSKKFISDSNENDPIMANTDESTQASLRLMDEIRMSRLFTIPAAGDFKKLTQRNTNLCVAFAAMRLLCFALEDFLDDSKHWKQDVTKQKLDLIRTKIINLPKIDRKEKNEQNKKQLSGAILDGKKIVIEIGKAI